MVCTIGACSLALPAGTFGERSPEPRRWWTSWESNPARRALSRCRRRNLQVPDRRLVAASGPPFTGPIIVLTSPSSGCREARMGEPDIGRADVAVVVPLPGPFVEHTRWGRGGCRECRIGAAHRVLSVDRWDHGRPFPPLSHQGEALARSLVSVLSQFRVAEPRVGERRPAGTVGDSASCLHPEVLGSTSPAAFHAYEHPDTAPTPRVPTRACTGATQSPHGERWSA